MLINIDVIDSTGLRAAGEQYVHVLPRLMRAGANKIRDGILERTGRGVDPKNRPFEPYTPAWSRFKGGGGHSTDKRNLYFTGQMFRAMMIETGADFSRIFFADAQQSLKAHGHHYNIPRRNPTGFFAPSVAEMEQVKEDIMNGINNLVSA